MQRFIFLACTFFTTALTAQQYPFVHYTPKDGLVNSRVRKAYQDSKGRMYFLTSGGLSVYDGTRFRNYTIQNGLANDLVNDIIEVGKDSLLVATNTFELNALVKGKMMIVKTEGTPCPQINQFYRTVDGKLYLSSDDGLFVMENKRVRKLDVSFLSVGAGLPYLGNIIVDGNYLVISKNELNDHRGLYLYDIKNDIICDALPAPVIFLLGKDKTNNTWLSMGDKLFILDSIALAKGKLLLIPPVRGYSQAKDYSATNIAFDKNCIWFVYRNQDYRNMEIRRIEENGRLLRMPLPQQATSSDIKNILVDRENTIWLCNDGEGVFKIVNSPLQIFENPFGQSTQGTITNAFYANHATWFSTNTNKLLRKSARGLQEFICNIKASPVLYDDGKKILTCDITNIYEADISNNKTIIFRKIIALAPPDFFPGVVRVDRNGFILASQLTGLAVWKNKKLILQLPTARNDKIEELAFDKNNFLWVVKRHNGIDVFTLHPEDPYKYLQLVYHFTPAQLTGSPRCFAIDKSGSIWVGTRDQGLIGYKQEGIQLKKIYHFTVSNGLTDNFVTSIACDSFNNIIVGTQTGLDRILFNHDSTWRAENLSKSSNFFTLIKQTWAEEEQTYALSFSGILLQVSAATTEIMNIAPQLLLEEMRVHGKTIPSEKNNFEYRENNINFLVAAPTFIDEKQVEYSYFLDGSGNNQWSDTSATNAVINLINLAPGKYLLKVKSFFPSTSYVPAELSYSFEIMPPWWQTWWYRSIVGLLIIGLLIIGSRFYYRRKLEKQMAVLEKQQAIEKERTRIATDMHDDLGAGLSRIKFLSETIGIKKQQQQPIEEDIYKIREYSHEMIDKMGEIVWALNEKNDTLSDLISYSRSYAIEYLSQHGIQCKVDMPETFPSVFVSGEFRRNVYLALKEALHNVVKHAQAVQVFISIRVNHQIAIIIQDDGIGFEGSNVKPFRNGLTNMKSRMNDIGGSLELANENGTIVKLLAPLP
ncbi:MAG: histidine kinase [Ginsengibacter sp.]